MVHQVREPEHLLQRILLESLADEGLDFAPGDRVEFAGSAVVDGDGLGGPAPVVAQIASDDAHLKSKRDPIIELAGKRPTS